MSQMVAEKGKNDRDQKREAFQKSGSTICTVLLKKVIGITWKGVGECRYLFWGSLSYRRD